jgi:hypothetical protein
MKQLIQFTPTFTPGNAGLGTLDFTALPGFTLSKLYAVIDDTQNSPLYITGTSQYGFAGFATTQTTLLLSVNTSTFSTTDKLTVIYETTPGQWMPDGSSNMAAESGGQLQQLQESVNQMLVELKVHSQLLAQGLTVNLTPDDVQSFRDDINRIDNQSSTF